MWNAEPMFGSAGNIMSMASGLSAMIEAMTTINSRKPIGRWPEDTKASALVSVTYSPQSGPRLFTHYAALHKQHSGMADRRKKTAPGTPCRDEGLSAPPRSRPDGDTAPLRLFGRRSRFGGGGRDDGCGF